MADWIWYAALVAFGASWVFGLIVWPLVDRFGGPRSEMAIMLIVMGLFWGSLGTGGAYVGYGLLTADWSDEPVPPASAAPSRAECHPSYKGACLDSDASDYDCGSGTGNGPRYVHTAVRVVDYDQFGLDGDGDGWGCD